MLRKQTITIISLFVFMLAVIGCSTSVENTKKDETSNGHHVLENDKNIPPYEGKPVSYVKHIYSTERKIALTFNGLPQEDQLQSLLGELDALQMKATFFVTGMNAAEEPELLNTIHDRGHEIQSLTLERASMTDMSYSEIYRSLKLSKQTLEQSLDTHISYVRRPAKVNEEWFQLAAAHTGYSSEIGNSLNYKESDLEDKLETVNQLRLFITRGGIIEIDLEQNEKIIQMLEMINQATQEVNYKVVTLSEMKQAELEKKPYNEILGYDLAQENANYKNVEYRVIRNGDRSKKEVALTFDDWGTDYTVTSILDILTNYNVPATFFLRGNGVERNPSLARSILEAGFEVANHTYSHPVITTISDAQLQEEVVRNHHVLTEALQQAPTMLFRPPTGNFDDHSARVIAATGYDVIANYDVTTFDWDNTNSADDIVQSAMEQLKNGSVILLHILDDIGTVEALPTIIEKIQAQGYTFVEMSHMVN